MTEEHPTAVPPATPVFDPLIGSVFAQKYRILQLLGSGGMGSVYKAEHTLMGRVVAVKLLHSHLATNPEYLQRFEKEARIASRITHPNAILLYDFGIEGTTPFLVMQYIEGQSLKDLLKVQGALPLERLGRIASQVCAAAAQAHSLQIVHRDLKPDNILISQDERGEDFAHVLDFGVAKFIGLSTSDLSVMATQTGVFSGTPQYMSPEQASQRPVDTRSDVYSMGVVLYEMLTGEVPFKSDSPLGMLIEHVQKLPTPARDLKPFLNIPPAVNAVVMKALKKDADERFASMEELSHALQAALAGSAAEPPSPAMPPDERTQEVAPLPADAEVPAAGPVKPCSNGPIYVVAAGLLVALLAGVFLVVRGLQSGLEDAAAPVALFSEELQKTRAAPPAQGQTELEGAAASDSKEAAADAQSVSPLPSASPPAQAASQSAQTSSEAFNEGRTLLGEKDYIRAGLAFKKALAADEDHLFARLYLGLCFQRLDKADRALEEFNKAIDRHPDSALARFMLSALHAERLDRGAALAALNKALALSPDAALWAAEDQSFRRLRDDPEFAALINRPPVPSGPNP